MINKNKILNYIRYASFFLAAAAFVCLSGCAEKKQVTVTEKSIFAMDTFMNITAYGNHGQEALDAAEKKIIELDNLLSTGKEDSEVSQLNKIGELNVSDTTASLIEQSVFANRNFGGVFTPLVYPLMKAWGFSDKNFRVPSDEEIKELLKLTDMNRFCFDPDSKYAYFEIDGMQIDFGGIAKGYTADVILKLMKEKGVESGVISLGGNIQTIGIKPDGSLWKVAIQNPYKEQSYMGILEVGEKSVVTSGAYERYFEEDGNIYHHIIDPRTGKPADSGIISSTAVTENGTLADALSTSLFILGIDKAEEIWKANADLFEFILMTEDDEIYITEGLKNSFKSEYKVNIISLS